MFFYSDAHELTVIIEEALSVENPPVEERSFMVAKYIQVHITMVPVLMLVWCVCHVGGLCGVQL